ncbi:MAG: hypothetical protein QM704_03085 [Anaeromyxobacteraceae bacterium]
MRPSLRSIVSPLAALALGGCAMHYRGPTAGEPAAMVKVRLDLDTEQATKLVPAHNGLSTLVATVLVHEDGEARVFATRKVPWSAIVDGKQTLGTIAVPVHAGRPAELEVKLAVRWTRTNLESVTARVPVTRVTVVQEPAWDNVSQTVGLANVKKYETKDESRTTTGWEKREMTAGCSARVTLAPAQGQTYVLDYENPKLANGCTLAAFVERARPDGSVELEKL